nr:hypothetical protein Q903MT_gene4410 [Picea sitchensis]
MAFPFVSRISLLSMSVRLMIQEMVSAKGNTAGCAATLCNLECLINW